ncbi:hypothetical protein BD413DRAFT_110217 [Trametes elegans]|nr:hypothetical protein BD413DRAFT_110217 [Trametes elegans]
MSDSSISAAALLAEIPTESLQSLLASVRSETSLPGLTHIPGLDTHLASVNVRRTSRDWPLNRGDVIEVQGPAASGKTHLIYHMLVTCLLPERYSGTELGGWGKAAILCDADGNFDVRRLHRLLVSRLRRFLGEDDPNNPAMGLEDMATECLRHLHVFRPTSSAQLAITLHRLTAYHATQPRLQNKEIGILAIDSMSAFYWRDRYTLEQIRDAADSSSRANLPHNPLLHVVQALAKLRLSHRPVTILSNWGLNPLSKPSANGAMESPFYKQHLSPFPAPFEPHGAAEGLSSISASQHLQDDAALRTGMSPARPLRPREALPLHCHITLHPSTIDPFPASFSVADALHHEHMRSVLVNKGEIRGLVRIPGDETLGEFTFRIGDEEVLVGGDEEP